MTQQRPAFHVIVLGCQGGPREGNLSGYLIAPIGVSQFLALDAGTLLEGIYLIKHHKKAEQEGLYSAEEFLKNQVQGYLLSHAHLDHVAGLIINSPIDTKKPIFGIDSTIDFIKDHLFNWKIWPNFGSEGENPLYQYQYKRLKPQKKTQLTPTAFTVESFLLNHPGGYFSSAFLLEAAGSYILYVGDTSSDALELEKYLQKVWKKVAPLILEKKLQALFLECSYPGDIEAKKLHGHLNPEYMLQELNQLALFVNATHPKTALQDFPVIVTHRKDLGKKKGSYQNIEEELQKKNHLGIHFIFPKQGQQLEV